MMRIALLVLKFGLLALMYLFIIRIFYFILSDLRNLSKSAGNYNLPEESGIGAELVVTESSLLSVKPGDTVKLGGEMRIGRGKNNDFKIDDSFVSHEHAKIIFRQGTFFLEDLKSINGTYINGVRIRETVPLKHGDTIKIAGVTFKFVRWDYEVE